MKTLCSPAISLLGMYVYWWLFLSLLKRTCKEQLEGGMIYPGSELAGISSIMTGQAGLPKRFSSWWQKLADCPSHVLADQEAESLGQNQKWISASSLPISSDPLPPARLHPLEVPQLPKVAAPAEDPVVKYIRFVGNISDSNHNSIQQKCTHWNVHSCVVCYSNSTVRQS